MNSTRNALVELHVEELVLEGFPHVDRTHLEEVVREELARLIAEQGVPPGLLQGGTVAHLEGGEFQVAPGATVQTVGVQIAQAVYGGLSQ